MTRLGLALLCLSGCQWAEIHKRSVLNEYHCEWPLKDRDLGPLQCTPLEDWAQEASVCNPEKPTMQKGSGPNHEL